MILYHGSNCEEMARKVADRFGGCPIVNAFEFDDSNLSTLNVKKFEQPNREWAEFVMANRSRGQEHPADNFDLIIGPVANDDIATLFRTFAINVITIDELVQGLKSRKLNNQYAFRSENAIAFLQKRPSV